jgi:hypothetical protein
MHASNLPGFPAASVGNQLAAVQSLIQGLGQMLRVAGALVQAGRNVDLAGIDRQIGLLCAKALDLPTPDGRKCHRQLVELRDQIDALTRQFTIPPPA